MTIAESDGTRLAWIAEVTAGTTPTTPGFQVMRYVSEGLATQKQTVQSGEIRADKNVADLIATGEQIAGTVDCELSYGTFDDLIAAGLRSSWSTDVAVNGIVPAYFTFEKTFEAGATDVYVRFRGCMINEINISAQPRQPVTIGFGVMGLGSDLADTAIITGATYTAATTEEVMPAGTYVGTITASGLTLPAIKGFDLTIAGQNREQLQIGSDDLAGLATGQLMVTGTLSLYFDSEDEYNAIKNHDSVAIVIPLGSVTTEKYSINIPVAKLMSGDPLSGGNGNDIQFDVEFQGQYDSGIGGTVEITRAIV